ncbi:hypothetical protein [Streptomyces sp. NBC_00239]|uniref:hypothetical protein n=1 Tax=Streptomyces sp. NBC_00239 TaxID=2903640 RepID=UPI002E2D023E|nr:hypothetical protein [Streptomyces sp. NBC_00239]
MCDTDGQCTGLVTQVQPSAVREGPAATDRLRLRDTADPGTPFTLPDTSPAEAEHAMRHSNTGALPAAGEHGRAPGVLVLSH